MEIKRYDDTEIKHKKYSVQTHLSMFDKKQTNLNLFYQNEK